MSPKCQIEIAINNISREKAKVIEKALEPDNVNFPKGLSLTINEKKKLYKFPTCYSLWDVTENEN